MRSLKYSTYKLKVTHRPGKDNACMDLGIVLYIMNCMFFLKYFVVIEMPRYVNIILKFSDF